jgi:carbonic anhydrase/acetyltransferase-like protein (isoleucine patch superfamily)
MPLLPYRGRTPILGEAAFVAQTATVIGNATLGAHASVWFGAVVRADSLAIVLGERTNVQDNAVVHVTTGAPVGGRDARGVEIGCVLGDDVTVGHAAVVHACTIRDRVLVGIGAIVLDGAVIESDVVIAAGSLVTPGTRIPRGSMVMGRPAKVVRPLDEADARRIQEGARAYVLHADEYRSEAEDFGPLRTSGRFGPDHD